ncbi:hypothetical protein [Allorhodopirellula solitaria]|uniref:Uncharacterized protein n=1 Tax=Allorhodopirellula solitaria TaxID=2527987 RepID=A0A5C5YGA7_9BACT|nr:hypothetical protein [Allorhodopirellula solitaria]TWT74400.1 hypothetical protein CA85_12890 [Allorhodopirellula solitaria]
MAIATKKRSSKSNQARYIGKPAGVIQQRVEAVGPSHFGVVSVDCAKRRSKSIHQVSRKRLSFLRQLPTQDSVLLRQTRSDAGKYVPLNSEKNL